MAKMTIAQMRKREAEKLATIGNANPTEQNIREAQRLMNSFYRLCGLCETNLYLSNNERTANTRRTAESEARQNKWFERLNKEFNERYGLQLYYCGFCPSIGHDYKHGGCVETINRYFYN